MAFRQSLLLQASRKTPKKLPPNHVFSKLVDQHQQEIIPHQNTEFTICAIRRIYWIPQPLPADRTTPYVKLFAFTCNTIHQLPYANSDESQLSMGDLVFLCGTNIPRREWSRGEKVELHPSRDGGIRQSKVRPTSGVMRSAVSNLDVLDVDVSESD
ncbi:unnamed protein product [Ceratitis capitata]|uniref:(Mediterranean fruit fly) hypothetical protein n=1 Tax=Ceratitis capitata TaxID=7213 RepID=A0A811UTR2_CERCA|nr:unnamed protein product [Ceratitis capitata]